MTQAVFPTPRYFTAQAKDDAQPVSLPRPQPFGAPVFITDAVTPLAGETVLSLLLKRMHREADER